VQDIPIPDFPGGKPITCRRFLSGNVLLARLVNRAQGILRTAFDER
jgi:hypothetical protein